MTNAQSPLTPAERARRDELLALLTRAAILSVRVLAAKLAGRAVAEAFVPTDDELLAISPESWRAYEEEARALLLREGRELDKVVVERSEAAMMLAGSRLMDFHGNHPAPAGMQ